jgi:hypothetical protein
MGIRDRKEIPDCKFVIYMRVWGIRKREGFIERGLIILG